MRITSNTVLITGGTSGIGLELAIQLQALGNTVIITGRDQSKLERIGKDHPLIHAIRSDGSDPLAVASLQERVSREFPALNILINNAGIMRKINLQDRGADLKDISREIETNLMGPVWMVKQFLPQLKQQSEAAIVNVSSGIAFSPFPISPIYSAAKAGLHAFTTALRVQLQNTNVRVIELAPPSTDTPLNGAFDSVDLKGVPMMKVSKVVEDFIRGLSGNRREILPGMSKVIRLGSRIAPNLMVKIASGSVSAMLSQTKQ
jgi:uncharacterized oxidoreductase